MSYIPYGKQDIWESDIDSVISVLKSDFLTQGPVVKKFEEKISEYCNVDFAIAVNSATSALHIACMALDLGPGDIAWTTPITFVATANAIRYCGAEVDFVDIDSKTYNLSVEKLERKLELAKIDGKLPKVVIPVHIAGQSCQMDQIYSLSIKYGFKIIEDASHSIGAKYKNQPVGNCQFSDITVFSFHPVKIITTGEGGVATTNHLDLAQKMRDYSSHGITKSQERMEEESHGDWYYEQIHLGYNYRMTEIQAALGLSQMDRLDLYIQRRNLIAEKYNMLLNKLPFTTPYVIPDAVSSFHLYIINLRLEELKLSHREIFSLLREKGIGVSLNYIPVYKQPYYKKIGFSGYSLENAEEYYRRAICIPLYPTLQDKTIDRIVTTLVEILK